LPIDLPAQDPVMAFVHLDPIAAGQPPLRI
jgi:hypothetical protein